MTLSSIVVKMSRDVPVISVTSLLDAKTKSVEAINLFKDVGVLVFRGFKFSDADHIELVKALGDEFDWNVQTGASNDTLNAAVYPGGHSDLTDREYAHTKDDYVLDWHIEQVYYIDPILAGAWNMTTFTGDSAVGNTRFVDSTELYETFSVDDQEFLSKCVVTWDKPLSNGKGPFFTKVVDSHPISGRPTLRVETDRGCYKMPELCLFDGNEPSSTEIARLDSLLATLKDSLDNNTDIRYSQEWVEGDLLIVDLFRMYHAVMGGFRQGERRFTGIGLRPKTYDNSLYSDLGLL